MTPEYLKMMNYGATPAYSQTGGDYHGSYTPSELLTGQEAGLGFMDSMKWDGEQTSWGGALDKRSGGFMSGGSGEGSGGIFGGMTDKRGADGSMTQGWGGMALGAASGLANAYLGFKQLGIAKDTLKFNKQKHGQNYDAQKRTTNASLEDRQRGRVASNAGAYESVGSYMDKNGIR